jgi:hypothetical protein
MSARAPNALPSVWRGVQPAILRKHADASMVTVAVSWNGCTPTKAPQQTPRAAIERPLTYPQHDLPSVVEFAESAYLEAAVHAVPSPILMLISGVTWTDEHDGPPVGYEANVQVPYLVFMLRHKITP